MFESIISFVRIKLTIIKFFILIVVFGTLLMYFTFTSSSQRLQVKTSYYVFKKADMDLEQTWNWAFKNDLDYFYENKSYFIDTIGCQMPRFETIDENVLKFIFNEKQINCGEPLTRTNNTHVWINLNRTQIFDIYGIRHINQLQCEYLSFYRFTDFENKYAESDKTVFFQFDSVVRVYDEFIRIICRNIAKNNTEIYRNYHFFLQPLENWQPIQTPFHTIHHKPMSVMVLGIDAVSRLNFHRQMNESVNVLLNELHAIELFGYNKVADNTYPNLIPVLSGFDENEINTACRLQKKDTFDRCHFIWNSFKAQNFTTTFSEDAGWLGLFQYTQPGFINQPTDYSIRPIMVEMEHDKSNKRYGNTFVCLNKQRSIDILLEYMRKLIDLVAHRLHFSFFWSSSFTHDSLNFAKLIDADVAIFFQSMRSTGALDNLFLVIMSDHGLRWGSFRKTYQGMIEERQPFVFIVPPTQFIERYPEAMRNLVKNRRRLTTPFDLYETFQDLLELESIAFNSIKIRTNKLNEMSNMPRGISLFLPIPKTRTCENAAIASHWCTCRKYDKFIDVTDPFADNIAQTVIAHLNNLLKSYPQCESLQLNAILYVNMKISDIKNVTNQLVNGKMATIGIQTNPGFGEFEATISIYNEKHYELTGTVSRTNLYRNQSHCVNDRKLKLYCFCGLKK